MNGKSRVVECRLGLGVSAPSVETFSIVVINNSLAHMSLDLEGCLLIAGRQEPV